MHDLFTKGLSYSAVNSASSALSTYFMGENLSNSEFSVVSHPLIKRYMKGYVCTGQTLKVLSFTSGQRCRTLTNLNISSMKKTGKYYLFKVDRLQIIVVAKKYLLCNFSSLPVRAVEHIALLLSHVKPFSPVGSSTVGHWIKNLLKQNGVDTSVFKAHSTRAASASKANQTVRIDAALKYIGWSTKSTFSQVLREAFCGH